MTAPTRAVAYIRVSLAKQAAEGVSLAAQRRKVELYAELHGLDLVAVVEDAGASAKTLDRPGLSRALGMLDTGEADALVVVKLDRLTRSVVDLGHLIETRFGSSDGPALLSVAESIDTRSAAGRLVLNILASVSQWEREAIGERTATALAHKRANGEYTGGQTPHGYRVAPDGVALERNPAEERALALVRQLRADGMTVRAVREELNSRGVLNRGRPWSLGAIGRLCKRLAA